jgi:uncharacterized repeat protein (TIGR02543 family)
MVYVYYHENWPGGVPGTGEVPMEHEVWMEGAMIYDNCGNLAKPNCTFLGWSNNPNATTPDLAANQLPWYGFANYLPEAWVDDYYNNGEILLYAIWQSDSPTNYTATYNGNGSTGGSVPTDSNVYTQNASVTVKANPGGLVRSGHTFLGWANTSSASTPTFAVTGSTVNPPSFNMPASNIILYAVWQSSPTTCNVIYNGNNNTGGSAPTDNNSPYNSGSTVTVLNQGTLTRTNYTFLGWNTNSSATTAQYATGQTFTINSNTTLYAIWQQNAPPTPTVTYNANWPNNVAGTGLAPSDPYSPYHVGDSVGVLANTMYLFKSGYNFLGWSTNKTATSPMYTVNGPVVSPGSFNMPSGNVVLYAVWQATSNSGHRVTYDANRPSGVSGTGSIPSDATNYAHQASVTVKANPNNLTANGYDFLGWAYLKSVLGTNFGVSGTTVTPSTFVITSSVTLYAVWRSNSVSNGGLFDGPIVLKSDVEHASKPSMFDIVKKIWGFDNGSWAPANFKDDERCKSWIMFTDADPPTSASGLNLFRIQTAGGSPLLVVDRGMVIQKDLSVGGFVSANQGALSLGSGLHTQVDIPKIILGNAATYRLDGGGMHKIPAVPRVLQLPTSGAHYQVRICTTAYNGNPPNTLYKWNDDNKQSSYWEPLGPISNFAGTFDTLYIRQMLEKSKDVWFDETPGHLDVGNIILHGALSNMQAGESSTENVTVNGVVKATRTIKFLREFSKIPSVTFSIRDVKDASGQYQDKHRYGRITEVTTKQFTIETYTIDHMHKIGWVSGAKGPAISQLTGSTAMKAREVRLCTGVDSGGNPTDIRVGSIFADENDGDFKNADLYSNNVRTHQPASAYFYWQAIEQTQYTVDTGPEKGKEKPR